MKKLVFTVQMIALIAMFPVYLVVELSQEKVQSTVENPASSIEQPLEKDNVQTSLADGDVQLSFLMVR